MKTFYLDIGNSFIKAAEEDPLGWNIVFQDETIDSGQFLNFISGQPDNLRLVTGSVRKDIRDKFEKEVPAFEWVHLSVADIPANLLNYDTPYTLGIDRYLACMGGVSISGKNVVVIDAGTACTIDRMQADFTFNGGVIMPGLKTLHRGLEVSTPELPVVDDDAIPDQWPGKSTKSCIQWGLNSGYLGMIDWFLRKYRYESGHDDIFVTGGGANFILNGLKHEYAFRHHPHLVFEGMKVFLKKIRSL